MNRRDAFSFVIPWYGHFAGGAEVAARSFAEQLAARGCDVEVLTTCCRTPFESWWEDTLPAGVESLQGVTVRRFPVNPHGAEIVHDLNHRMAQGHKPSAEEQRRYVRHTINSDALVAYAAANCRGRTIIGVPYTQGLIWSLLQALPGEASLISCLHDEPQMRWVTTEEMLGHARQVFLLTEEEKSLAIRHYGPRLGRRVADWPVVGVGVELPRSFAADDRAASAQVAARYRLPSDYVVYVGRKDRGKNVGLLVQFFQEYANSGGDSALVFLGGGDPQLVPEHPAIRDLGFLPEADKYALLTGAKALINLSDNESFSIVIMEAWLCGVPTIVSAGCEVTAAHCRKSGGGIAVADAQEFAAALRLVGRDSQRTELGAAGRRYVRKHYAWPPVLERLVRGAA